MVEVALPVPAKWEKVETQVESACQQLGLTPTLKSTLKAYPGSIHWHYKLARQPGTLEITWWPKHERLWAKVARSRSAAWMPPMLLELQQLLQK